MGELDRAISRSKDPFVKALGAMAADLLSGAGGADRIPLPRDLREQIARMRAQMAADARARGQQPPHSRSAPPPRPSSPPPPDPLVEARRVMGFEPTDVLTKEIVGKRKQALAKVFHPDLPSGSAEQMKRINQAADLILAKLP